MHPSATADLKLPLTSAPAEKNLPSPVKTVKHVSGSSFKVRMASTVSSISFPPKEFNCFGRLNYKASDVYATSVSLVIYFDGPYLTSLLNNDILIFHRHSMMRDYGYDKVSLIN